MDKISWCKEQKNGIRLVEPNERVGREYIKEADIDLKNISGSMPKWKVISGYYACYNAFYAILQKIGIKSEIHDCSIDLITYFEEVSGFKRFLRELKKNRIGVQYYLKEPTNVDTESIQLFILGCKEIFNDLSPERIKEIREHIEKI